MVKSNRFAKNDEGVSAVIGVILMVAITVILAAVIAAFVFGMVGGVKKTYNIAATASRQGSTVTVTYNGGPDNDQLKAAADGLIATVTNDDEAAGTGTKGADADIQGSEITTAVGSTATYDAPGKVHVIVVATFKDNAQQVILDSHV